MADLNKIMGSLVGGAAGDALGYAVEFMREKEIFEEFGGSGITEYDLSGGKAVISDDTQMTLFTAMGLIAAARRAVLDDRPVYRYLSCIIPCYQDWYHTQMKNYPYKPKIAEDYLMDIPELFARRAPGNTCLSAIREGCDGSPEEPINNSKGCGGIMRVAPIGLFFAGSEVSQKKVDELGARAAALTHGHPLGYLPAAVLVHIISKIMEGASVKDAVKDAAWAVQVDYKDSPGYTRKIADLIEKALELSESGKSDLDAIHELGEGWVGEETMAIAVYCALKYPDDLDRCLIAAVNHNGDSDSTGAVAGNIVGAAIGFDRIPEKYLRDLEMKDLICKVAEDLAAEAEKI